MEERHPESPHGQREREEPRASLRDPDYWNPHRKENPQRPFASLNEVDTWVAWFVRWYNIEHRHSAIRFVTPDERHHSGRDVEILAKRQAVYEAARARHPERWSRKTRDWSSIEEVVLNRDRAAEEVA